MQIVDLLLDNLQTCFVVGRSQYCEFMLKQALVFFSLGSDMANLHIKVLPNLKKLLPTFFHSYDL